METGLRGFFASCASTVDGSIHLGGEWLDQYRGTLQTGKRGRILERVGHPRDEGCKSRDRCRAFLPTASPDRFLAPSDMIVRVNSFPLQGGTPAPLCGVGVPPAGLGGFSLLSPSTISHRVKNRPICPCVRSTNNRFLLCVIGVISRTRAGSFSHLVNLHTPYSKPAFDFCLGHPS